MEETKLNLTKNIIICLYIYYLLIFAIGGILGIIFVIPGAFNINDELILFRSIFASIGMALLGSSIFYIRKLYKSCIKGNIERDDTNCLSRIGASVYYFARPLFSIGFSLIIVVGINAEYMLISKDANITNDSFIHICMFFSFFGGFGAGRFIKYLEGKSISIFKKE